MLVGVTHALALVGLGSTQFANVGSNLTNELFVDAIDVEPGRGFHLKGDSVRRLVVDRMAEAQSQFKPVALRLYPVAGPDNLESLAVALSHTDHHVVDQRAGQAVQLLAAALIIGASHAHLVVSDLNGDRFRDCQAEFTLRALHHDLLTRHGDLNRRRDFDG